jgi:hypothetical protein
MKNIMKILGAMVLAIGMLMPIQAGATLYVTDGTGTGLATVDTASGTGTVIGAINPRTTEQLMCQAFTPDGTLWAYDTAGGGFFTVNPATAALTPVGVVNPANIGCTALASDANGNLFMMSQASNQLYSVNKADGSTTVLGVVTNSGGAPMPLGMPVYGLAFDSAGVLHVIYNTGAAHALFTLDPATVITPIASFVLVTGIPGVFVNMTIDTVSGVAYATNHAGIELYTLNLTTGVGTLVGNTGLTPDTFALAATWPAPATGGGGCVLNAEAGFDPLLPLLALIALGFLYRRRSSI